MIERRAQDFAESRVALYSPCQAYRYSLKIVWCDGKPIVLYVALNPSKATELRNDNTMVRMRGFAAAMGFGGMVIANAAALRETDRLVMLRHQDPIGPENTPEFLASIPCDLVVGCWGSEGRHEKLRAQTVAIRAAFGDRLHAFRLTKQSELEHPLYLPGHLRPRPLRELEQEHAA